MLAPVYIENHSRCSLIEVSKHIRVYTYEINLMYGIFKTTVLTITVYSL